MAPEFVIVPAFFTLVVFTVWMSISVWLRRQHLMLIGELSRRLIDKLSTVQEFSAFAKSEAGQEVLDALFTESVGRPEQRILRAVEMGIVLAALGLGLVCLGQYFEFEGHEAFTAVGVISLSLGIGFLVSAAVSHRIASRATVRPVRPGQRPRLEG